METNAQSTSISVPRRSPLESLALIFIVFTSGAAVMIFEFIAVRMLQRFYGSSLDVWAAEISVCLVALALGYSLGGYLADRFHSWKILGAALVIAGASAIFMEQLVVWSAQALISGETMRWWEPLAASAIATFVPLLALGTVMPQAIRLHVRRFERVGASAGRVAAVSTVGSVCGTLATSSLFVQWGVRESLYVTCADLIALGVIIMLVQIAYNRVRRHAALVLIPLCASAAPAQENVLFEDYTAYHHILVKDEGPRRVMYFDSSPQSTMNINDPYTGGFEYTDYFHVPLVIDPTMTSVLFVGLGGGSGPKSFLKSYPNLKKIEVVEIDPDVVKVAKRFFSVPEDPKLRIITTDGRTFLQRSSQKYGAIIMDAYGSGPNGAYLPYHLATVEFFEAAWERLENGGCLVYNVMGTYGGSNDDIVRGMVVTLENVFQHVYVFQAGSSWNTVYLAQKIDYDKLAPNNTRDGKGWPEGPWMSHPADLPALAAELAQSGVYVHTGLAQRMTQFSRAHTARRNGRLFTDNNAPVDIAPGRR